MAKQASLVLVINCGSSSLKFGLFETPSLSLIYEGLANELGSDKASASITEIDAKQSVEHPCKNHADALGTILGFLSNSLDLSGRLVGVGHRVVHGGELFKSSIVITEQVLQQIKACIPLAPLHNPANIQGIQLSQQAFPEVPQIAVFDTAFHQTMPPEAYIYALPYELYENLGVRRYGFHGSSHRYVARQAERALGIKQEGGNFVTAHLGNGASVCAIKNGVSVDTSMGMTPLEGLVMGTRSGDIDPGIFDYLINQGYSATEINNLLNKESGLKGISQLSNDMRTLSNEAEGGNTQCALAIEIFCLRLAKYIGAMLVSLRKIDALIFTGGIGENSALIRKTTTEHLLLLGFSIDTVKNQNREFAEHTAINTENSHPILVIRTDEEKMIASDTYALITPTDAREITQ